MNETVNQLRKKIEQRIDELKLGDFKSQLLAELNFHYRLNSFETEDYSSLGNSRFGGFPDLPKDIDYPISEEGYYNLLCQINFSDFGDKMGKIPEEGILYIFDGHCVEDDFKVFYSKSTENLETKFPPKGLENLNAEYREEVYDGIKVNFEIEHYFNGNSIWKIFEESEEKYNKLIQTTSKYKSSILGRSLDGTVSAYLAMNGFDRLIYTTLLYEKSEVGYQKNLKSLLDKHEKNMLSSNVNKEAAMKYKEQLLTFDKEKKEHFKNFQNVICLIALESLHELEWEWGDMGFKYLYILNKDLVNLNFENVIVETWSS